MKDWRKEKEDESGDSEDSEDDELPCVIGDEVEGWRTASD